MQASDSFIRLLNRLESGEDDAATELFERYAQRLLRLARSRLDGRLRGKVDAEDVLQSVFRSFFSRHAGGKFELRGWGSLWAVLTVMTVRRCYKESAHHRAARRDVRREAQLGTGPAVDDESPAVWQPPDRDPLPDEIASLTELVERLMNGLNDFEQEVLSLRLQGYTVAEISEKVIRTERTVHRILAQIRRRALKIGGIEID